MAPRLGERAGCRAVKKLFTLAARHLGGRPTVEALGAEVPIKNAVIQVFHGDGVARLIEQRGLLENALTSALTFGKLGLQGFVESMQLREALGVFQGRAGDGGDEIRQTLLILPKQPSDLAVRDIKTGDCL